MEADEGSAGAEAEGRRTRGVHASCRTKAGLAGGPQQSGVCIWTTWKVERSNRRTPGGDSSETRLRGRAFQSGRSLRDGGQEKGCRGGIQNPQTAQSRVSQSTVFCDLSETAEELAWRAHRISCARNVTIVAITRAKNITSKTNGSMIQ